MTVSTEKLRELHRLHQQLRDLKDRQRRGPKQVEVHQANVNRLQAEIDAHKESTQAAQLAAKTKETALKSAENKIGDLKVKLNTCSTNKEYKALQDQIAADKMACSVLEDEILEAFEKVDKLKSGQPELDAGLAKTQADLKKAEEVVAAEQEMLRSEIDRIEGELVEAEKVLPADIRQAYDRVVASKGDEAMAPLDGEVCAGCYMQITPNMLNQLLMSEVVFCKSCGRLLYVPEDRSVK